MVIADHWEKLILIVSNGNLPNYHSTIIRGKMYPTTVLQFSIKLLHLGLPLTLCLLNVILGISKEILNIILYTWYIYNDNLKSYQWLIIDMIYYLSIYLRMIIGVSFVSLSLFMLVGVCIPVFSRVLILLNCDFQNTLLWRIWGLSLSFTMFSMIFLRTSKIDVI